MTEELGPCPAGHTTTYIVEDVQVGVNLTATAFYGECECGWRGPIRYQLRQGASIAWGIRAESAEVERLRALCEFWENASIRHDKEVEQLRARVAELEAIIEDDQNAHYDALAKELAQLPEE